MLKWFSVALCQLEQLFPITTALVLTVTHLVLDTLHGGPAERGDVHSHRLPVLTQYTQLELYCLPLLQTVTFVGHANNSKGIDLSFHLTWGGKYETELRGLSHLISDFQYYKCCFYSQLSSVDTLCRVNKVFNTSIYSAFNLCTCEINT